MSYDSRPSQLQTSEIERNSLHEFIVSLQSINPHTPCMWETVLLMKYDDFELTDSEVAMVQCQVRQLIANVTPAVLGPVLVTSEQGTNAWSNERRVRVTASSAKQVCSCATESRFRNLVNDKLWRKSTQTAAMVYGHEHELLARETFQCSVEQEIEGFHVAETGMWVNQKYPGIGASPDGVLYDPVSCTSGVLEIKCPQSMRNDDPNKFDECLTAKRLTAFCLRRDESSGEMKLKVNHEYHYQMQLQMAVCEMQWGYFVVWTPCGMHFEKVLYDSALVGQMIPKLTTFHRMHLCPEYF